MQKKFWQRSLLETSKGVIRFDEPLTNHDLDRLAYVLRIPKYRGTFSKDRLPASIWKRGECGIVNLQDFDDGEGSHWVAYSTVTGIPYYFDSFGDLPPPISLVKYIGRPGIRYNVDRVQGYNQILCGHLCLYFLLGITNGENYESLLYDITIKK